MDIGMRDGSTPVAGYASTLAGLRDLGVHSCELAVNRNGRFRSLVSDAELDVGRPADRQRLANEAAEGGVRIQALLCAQDFNGPERAAHLAYVVNTVETAAVVGAVAVRVDIYMTGQGDLPLSERVDIYVQGLREVLAATPVCGVALGVENHGPQGNDEAWMRGVMAALPEARIGLTLDVGNWYWYGYPLSHVYDIYREFGSRVKHTHVKNINYPPEMQEKQREIGYKYGEYCCPLDEGNLDMARVVSILRECGYDGDLVIEDESVGKYPPEERPRILHRDVACLRAALSV